MPCKEEEHNKQEVTKLFQQSKNKMNISTGYSKVHGVRKCLELDSWLPKRKRRKKNIRRKSVLASVK